MAKKDVQSLQKMSREAMFDVLPRHFGKAEASCDGARHGRLRVPCADCRLQTQIRSNCWIRGLTANRFLQRVSIACYAERCTSYSKSVRHTLALCQNDSSYHHGVFTGG